jgi:hypothetical protein
VQRTISGSSRPLRSEDDQEIRNIERRRWQVGQRHQEKDPQTVFSRGEDQDRAGWHAWRFDYGEIAWEAARLKAKLKAL